VPGKGIKRGEELVGGIRNGRGKTDAL
jgi:hypothetical protein